MVFASREKIVELQKLENEYFDLTGTVASETARCILRGQLVKGFVKSKEMVEEAIEKLTEEISNLKVLKMEKEEAKKQEQENQIVEDKKLGYASLTGSEKQIKWANTLRKEFVEKVERIKEESKKD